MLVELMSAGHRLIQLLWDGLCHPQVVVEARQCALSATSHPAGGPPHIRRLAVTILAPVHLRAVTGAHAWLG